MTLPRLLPHHEDRARALASEAGQVFRSERTRRGDDLKDVAQYLGTSPTSLNNIVRFEQGATPHVMLSTVLRFLSVYGYTLAIVKRDGERS